MTMELKRASIEDAEEILSLQRAAFQSEAALHDNFDIPPLTQSLEELRAEFATRTVLKICDGGKLIASGQVYFKSGSSYIGRMAVWPAYQGQGIGSKLLTALENVFPQASRMELFTGEKSIANLSMYKRRGYREFKSAQSGKTKVIFLERILENHALSLSASP